MNFVLRTAHAEEKKKGGHTNPDVRTIMKNPRCITHVGLASLAQLFIAYLHDRDHLAPYYSVSLYMWLTTVQSAQSSL